VCPPLEVLRMEYLPLEYFHTINEWDNGSVSVSSTEDDLVEFKGLLLAVPQDFKLPSLVVRSLNDSANQGIELYMLIQTKVGSIGVKVVERLLRIHVDRCI
jgi:hypothetical protein